MKILNVLIVLALFLAPTAFAAEWVALVPNAPEGSTPEINVLSSNAAGTEVEILLPGFYAEQTAEGYVLSVPGWSLTENVGLPSLPAAKFLLALPEGASVETTVADRVDHEFMSFKVSLLPEPEKDGAAPSPAPVPVPWQGDYPGVGVETGEAGYIRHLPVTSVKAYPFLLNRETGILTVSSRMQVTVHHGSTAGAWAPVVMNPQTQLRCAGSVLNFNSVPTTTARAADTQYLIITTPGLAPTVQPLMEWRCKTGFKTEVVAVSTSSSQTVKNIILGYPNIEYVLLVGDSGEIPMHKWSYNYGDHWYACTTGGSNPDCYADLSLGRLCGSNASRITPQIDKILEYEQSPPLGPWLKTTLMVAHGEQYPGKYTECKQAISIATSGASDWVVHEYWGGLSGTTNAGISNFINNGASIVNYRGHGNDFSWTGWNKSGEYYEVDEVEALVNGDMRPIVFNIACNCSNIATYCMSEAWMDTPGGAVASLGAVEPSYTVVNHDYDKKLYEAIFSMGITDIGGVMDYATDFTVSYHGSWGEENARMYLWLGDPAMKVWKTIPSMNLNATHDTVIDAGVQTFDVAVTGDSGALAGAKVCLYLEDEVHEVGTTNALGQVSFTISPVSPTFMSVTVTHEQYLPIEGSVQVDAGSLLFDTNKISARNGGTVNFTLDLGPAYPNRMYLLMGGASGTDPGTPLPGGLVTLPLNFDAVTSLLINIVNTPVLVDFYGYTDGGGNAAAQLNAPSVDGGLVGVNIYFAFALLDYSDYVSNPVAVKIVP